MFFNRLRGSARVGCSNRSRIRFSVSRGPRRRGFGAIESLEPRCVLSGVPLVTAVYPKMGAMRVDPSSNMTAEFSVAMDPATLDEANISLSDAHGQVLPATTSYDAATRTITIDPVGDLAVEDQYFTITIRGGADGVRDASGNSLSSDFQWSWTTGKAQFEDTVVWDGITAPTAIRFASDGRVFVAEQAGRIWVFDNLDDQQPDLFADLSVNVMNLYDNGLIGLALAPDFPADPYIYITYTYDGDIPGTSPGGVPAQAAPKYGNGVDPIDAAPDIDGRGVWVSGRLSRLTADGNFMVGDEEVLIHDWVSQFPGHSVGAIQFGPDGALYTNGGDGASYSYADYGQPVPPNNPGNPFGDPEGEGGALRSQDLRTPLDPTTLDGAVIRVDPNTGLALPDNPLFKTGNDENARRIIAYGMRNPYRFVFRPGTDEIWMGDVGWTRFEEINRIGSATDSVVENFGWPAYEGYEPEPLYASLDLPLLRDLYAAGPEAHVEPYFAYAQYQNLDPDAPEATSFSAITGLAFTDGSNFPAAFDGALLMTDYARRVIWAMYRGVDGLPDPNNVRAIVAPAENPVDLIFGPDGNLYYPDYFGGAIRRVQFVAPPQPAGFTGTEGADRITARLSGDGQTLDLYEDDNPGGDPIFTWPLDSELPLTISTLAGDDVLTIDLPADATGPAAGILLDAGDGRNRLWIHGGHIRVDTTPGIGSLDIEVRNNSVFETPRLSGGALSILDSAKVMISAGSETSRLTSLLMSKSSTLDIGYSSLVIDYSGVSPLARIAGQILAGRAASGDGNGTWTGVGIVSSVAAAANETEPDVLSIGYAENNLLPLGPYNTFGGQAVDETSILIRTTRTGDANMDGVVNDDDVTIVNATYAPGVPQPSWTLGDFDYDGFVDDDDVTLLGAFYNAPEAAIEPFTFGLVTTGELAEFETASIPSSDAAAAPTDAAGLLSGLAPISRVIEQNPAEIDATLNSSAPDDRSATSREPGNETIASDFVTAVPVTTRQRVDTHKLAALDALWSSW